tara:strand:- start:624 stop:794 length:171 start_codon:yes stop_codon:yes gene_type:complete
MNVTEGTKCVGCYTTKGVKYCYTSLEGKTWESCENCLDKVRKIRDDYFNDKNKKKK